MFTFCLVVFLLYPGIYGPKLLDDNNNLDFILTLNSNTGFLNKVIHGLSISGWTNRPLSFITFFAQSDAWPHALPVLKLFNLILHFINSLLVFFISEKIGTLLFSRHSKDTQHGLETQESQNTNPQIFYFAFFSAFIWLIHPLQHSTVFYLIQRMTELSSFFILLGIAFYLQYRPRFNLNKWRDFSLFYLIMGLWMTLAIASKENGILLPLFIALIHYIWRQSNAKGTQQFNGLGQKWFIWLFMVLPWLLLLVYLYATRQELAEIALQRGFTLSNHLLTESRILLSYLWRIITLDIYQMGVFQDDFPLSTDLFQPVTTLLSVSIIILAIMIGWRIRHAFPIFFLAIAWFLIAHILESTFLPLELVFEHRNYLALLGPIWLVVYGMIQGWHKFRPYFQFLAVGLLAYLCLMSYLSARIWRDSGQIAINHAMFRVHSARAQNYLAYYYLQTGRPKEGLAVFAKTWRTHPDNLTLRVSELLYRCYSGNSQKELANLLSADIRHFQPQISLVMYLEKLYKLRLEHKCPDFSTEKWHQFLNHLYRHPRVVQKIRDQIKWVYTEEALNKKVRELRQETRLRNFIITKTRGTENP